MNTLGVFKGTKKKKQEGYSLENQEEGDKRGEQRSQPVDHRTTYGCDADGLSKTHFCSCIWGRERQSVYLSKWPLMHWPL